MSGRAAEFRTVSGYYQNRIKGRDKTTWSSRFRVETKPSQKTFSNLRREFFRRIFEISVVLDCCSRDKRPAVLPRTTGVGLHIVAQGDTSPKLPILTAPALAQSSILNRYFGPRFNHAIQKYKKPLSSFVIPNASAKSPCVVYQLKRQPLLPRYSGATHRHP